MEFDKFPVQTISNTWGNEWKINSRISYLQIEVISSQKLSNVMITINCGEPEIFEIPSTILQGYEVVFTVFPPILSDYWINLCDNEVKILNEPPLDFLTYYDG